MTAALRHPINWEDVHKRGKENQRVESSILLKVGEKAYLQNFCDHIEVEVKETSDLQYVKDLIQKAKIEEEWDIDVETRMFSDLPYVVCQNDVPPEKSLFTLISEKIQGFFYIKNNVEKI